MLKRMESVQECWYGIYEDFSVLAGDDATQKKAGLTLSVVIDGLIFFSLSTRTSYVGMQISALDVILCALSLLGTVLFIWPHRRYQLQNGTMLSVWVPNVFGRQLFCFCNPLAVLILLDSTPILLDNLLKHVVLAVAVTAICTLLVNMYERLLVQRSFISRGCYDSLQSFLEPLAFKDSVDAATQTGM